VRSLGCPWRAGIIFSHRPGMGKPNLGEAAAEPHSALLFDVYFLPLGFRTAFLGVYLIFSILARGRGVRGECPAPKTHYTLRFPTLDFIMLFSIAHFLKVFILAKTFFLSSLLYLNVFIIFFSCFSHPINPSG